MSAGAEEMEAVDSEVDSDLSDGSEFIAVSNAHLNDPKAKLEHLVILVKHNQMRDIVEDPEDVQDFLGCSEGLNAIWVGYMMTERNMDIFTNDTGKDAQNVIDAILDPVSVMDEYHRMLLRIMVQETLCSISYPPMGYCQASLQILNNRDVLEKNPEILEAVFHNLNQEMKRDNKLFALAVCNGLVLDRDDRARLDSPHVLRAHPPVLPFMSYEFLNRNNAPVERAIRCGALKVRGTLGGLPENYLKSWHNVRRGIEDDEDALQMIKLWILRFINQMDNYGNFHGGPLDFHQTRMVAHVREHLERNFKPLEYRNTLASLFLTRNMRAPNPFGRLDGLEDQIVRKIFCDFGFEIAGDEHMVQVQTLEQVKALLGGRTLDTSMGIQRTTFTILMELHGVPSR